MQNMFPDTAQPYARNLKPQVRDTGQTLEPFLLLPVAVPCKP